MKTKNSKIKLVFVYLAIFSLGSLFIIGSSYAGEIPNSPTDVYIDQGNNILMVTKPNDIPKPFVIKGVGWSAATKAPAQGPDPLNLNNQTQYGFFFDWDGRNPNGHDVLNYWLTSQLRERCTKDLPLIKNMNANTVRIYHSLGSNVVDYTKVAPGIKIVLDECYKNGIMVIMAVAISKEDLSLRRYLQVVNSYKEHPAILMWAIGNEWNFNKFYGFSNLEDAARAVNQAAVEIKGIDQHHPVSSILGDKFVDFPIVLTNCPSVDVWGINVYRGNDFGSGDSDLFQQWKNLWEKRLQQPAKPLYISEFGIDSFRTASYITNGTNPTRADDVTGSEDQQRQADVDSALWQKIVTRLSAKYAGEYGLGGVVFEFNDELWKVGNYHVGLGGIVNYASDHSYDDYNKEGFVLLGASPDNVLNEEYFGLVKADRGAKLAYKALQKVFNLAPIAKISIYNTFSIGKFDLYVVFRGDSSYDLDGQVVSYSWKFGDGSNSSQPNPTHKYIRPTSLVRKYTVTLTVKDNKGATATAGTTIEVSPP